MTVLQLIFLGHLTETFTLKQSVGAHGSGQNGKDQQFLEFEINLVYQIQS